MATPIATRRLSRYWPVAAGGGLIGLALIAYLVSYGPSPLIKRWGVDAAGACTMTFDGRFLERYAKDYNAVAVCGVDLPNTDRLSSVAISLSTAYQIESRDQTVQIPPDPPMKAATEFLVRNTKPEGAPGTPILNLYLWYELVLLPKGTASMELQSVSDVEKLKGIRFPDETRETTHALRRP